MKILLVGVGPIGIEYAQILKDLGHQILALGRSEKGCIAFEEKTGIKAIQNGVEKMKGKNLPKTAIVAVSEAQLGKVVMQLIERGIKSILVEKPGAGNENELITIANAATKAGCDVRVAYNRRFYASTIEAKKIIEEDGGVKSFLFEFSEWSHRIEQIIKEPGVKDSWFFHNSSHVVDLAFYLGGIPKEIKTWTSGKLKWHKNARYTGAGETINGALFAYIADWQGPGRWGVELITNKYRLYLKPLEKLMIQEIGSVELKVVNIDDSDDIKYKPGFYKQLEIFLTKKQELITIKEQVEMLNIYKKINK